MVDIEISGYKNRANRVTVFYMKPVPMQMSVSKAQNGRQMLTCTRSYCAPKPGIAFT